MTVKDLLVEVDMNRLIEAFLLTDYRFCRDNRESSLCDRVALVPKMADVIRNFVSEINLNDFKPVGEPSTLFIFEIPLTEYEDKGEVIYDIFFIEDKLAYEEMSVKKSGEYETLDHFEVDYIETDEFLNFQVAEYSINEFGKEICAAFILSHMLRMGRTIEERQVNIQKFNDELDGKKEWLDPVSIEEFLDEMDRLFTEGMSEEEKLYHQMKDEFDNKTREFRRNYSNIKDEENHRKLTDGIYGEYRRRRA